MARISKLAVAMCLALASMSPMAGDAFSLSPQISSLTQNRVAFMSGLEKVQHNNRSILRMSAGEGEGKSVLVKKENSSVEVTITASGKATKSAYDKACAEVSRSINIKGFRKGAKIPPAVIENALSNQRDGKFSLKTQAINDLLNSLLEPALKDEHNLEPLGQPSLVTPADELANSFKPGEPMELTIRCDVWPDIQWKEGSDGGKPYLGLKGTYEREPFDQVRFEAALNDLRERYATTTPLEDQGQPLQMGDACMVNMEGWMAVEEGGEVTKGEPLPNVATGDNVEIILGPGRYMDGLVEGLVGAKVGETKTVTVSFPQKLRDKTLAGKKAVFEVSVLEASTRTVPEITDEFAEEVRPGLTKDALEEELKKAVDEQSSQTWTEARNSALGKSLAEVLEVDVPDTLITKQAQEKYAMMMTEFREQGMADEEIKRLISPENFLKYKGIEAPDIIRDFKVSMAVDEIARLEGIEVPDYQVEEQFASIKKEQEEQGGDEEMDETMIRRKIETTLMRRLVFDFLAENADLEVVYKDKEPEFDEALLEQLAQDTIKREEAATGKEDTDSETVEAEIVSEEAPVVQETVEVKEEVEEVSAPADLDDADMDPDEKAFKILVNLGMVQESPDPDSPDYDHSTDDEFAPENQNM